MTSRILFFAFPLLVACKDTTSSGGVDSGDNGRLAPSMCPQTLPHHVACKWTTPTGMVCPFGSVGGFCDPSGVWVCKTPRCSFFGDSGTSDAQLAAPPATGTPCDPATMGICISSDS